MAKMRVYQLAKELGMSSKELIGKLRDELDIQVKNAQSGLDEKQVMLVKEFIKPVSIQKKEEKKAKVEKPKKQAPKPKLEKVEPEKEEAKQEKVKVTVEEKPIEEKPRKEERRRKDVRVLSPEEIARRRRKRKFIKQKPREERKPLREIKQRPKPIAEKKKEEKVTREQLEKLVTSMKEQREREKPKTEEELIAEKKREKRELEEQKKFQELMRKIEEKNRAKAKRKKRKKKEKETPKEIPFEELSEEEQLQRLIEEEERQKTVVIPEVISVKELAEKLNVEPNQLIGELITLGKMVTLNQPVDFETAKKLIESHGKIAKLESEEVIEIIEEEEEAPENLKPRPPVVTVMGHVDHGKTTLLDYIRNTKIAEREAGGITQHIGASVVEVETPEGRRKITFLDTPGHEAFTAMRARGAQVTDIAILVVAADDGVMPQTVEAINHSKAAGIPIIVAINKIDKPGANPEKVKQELTQYGLIPEDWGGDTIMVPVSAKTGQGVDELLEMVVLQADMMDLKANPDRPARGVVLEARLDRQKGPVATLLVQNGTLKVGDSVVAGLYAGKIRAMFDDRGKQVKEAGPSMAVEVLGLDGVPQAGDKFAVVKDEKTARKIAEHRQELARESAIEKQKRLSLEDLFSQMQKGEVKELNIIVKADAQGSIEAIRKSLEDLSTDEVKVNIIHSGTGPITENDIMLATASNAIVIGFNVRPDSSARKAAEKEKVDVRTYRVIYEIVDDIKKAMQGLLKPEEKEVYLGSAEVRATFKVPKVGTVAGCYVKDGVIRRNANVRLVRDGVVIFEGKISSLKRFKEDVREVQAGYECGIGLENFNDIKVGDTIECYTTELVEKET